ncbi:MAG: hypothetical protein U0174_21995 [Polyangiaceae bacterium]
MTQSKVVGVFGVAEAAGIKLEDDASLPDQVRKRYDLEKAKLVGHDIYLGGTVASEADFFRQYRTVVGDGAPTPSQSRIYDFAWPAWGSLLGGTVMASSIPIFAGRVDSRGDERYSAGIPLAVLGLGAAICGGSAWIGAVAGPKDMTVRSVSDPDLERKRTAMDVLTA